MTPTNEQDLELIRDILRRIEGLSAWLPAKNSYGSVSMHFGPPRLHLPDVPIPRTVRLSGGVKGIGAPRLSVVGSFELNIMAKFKFVWLRQDCKPYTVADPIDVSRVVRGETLQSIRFLATHSSLLTRFVFSCGHLLVDGSGPADAAEPDWLIDDEINIWSVAGVGPQVELQKPGMSAISMPGIWLQQDAATPEVE